jgi:hypothetical protein
MVRAVRGYHSAGSVAFSGAAVSTSFQLRLGMLSQGEIVLDALVEVPHRLLAVLGAPLEELHLL